MKVLASVIRSEARDMFVSPAGSLCLAVFSVMLGAGFYLALGRYAAAATVVSSVPLPGAVTTTINDLFAPAFNTAFHLFLLILPLFVTRNLFRDNGCGAINYLGQVCGQGRLFTAKCITGSAYLCIGILLSLPAVYYWIMLGGPVPASGLALMYAGFIIEGMLAVAVSYAASSLSRNYPAAAGGAVLVMATLLFPDLLAKAGGLSLLGPVPSLVTMLAPLEHGILPVGPVAITGAAVIGLMLLSLCVYSRERHDRSRVYIKVSIAALLIGICLTAAGSAGLFGTMCPVREKDTVPGKTVQYGDAVKTSGPALAEDRVVNNETEFNTTTDGPVITACERRDILVLYCVVIPLILLLFAIARGLGSSGLPDGRKKTIILVMTWLVIMVSLALVQDFYFKNRSWKAFPSVREILPRWAGSVGDVDIGPGPFRPNRRPVTGRTQSGPFDPNCLYAGKDYEYLKRFFRKLSDLQAQRRDNRSHRALRGFSYMGRLLFENAEA